MQKGKPKSGRFISNLINLIRGKPNPAEIISNEANRLWISKENIYVYGDYPKLGKQEYHPLWNIKYLQPFTPNMKEGDDTAVFVANIPAI